MSTAHHLQSLRLAASATAGDPARAAALYLSGGNPADWLEEICAWGGETTAAQAEMRLCVLPAGVLVILPGGQPTPVSPRAQPYSVLAGRMYLPLGARLDPPVSDEELARLCTTAADDGSGDAVFVFHPGAGLCRFGPGDARHLADLLAPPARSIQTWVGAHPGSESNARLRSVRLELPTDGMDGLFGDAARDIGAEADSGEPLPLIPGEKPPGLAARATRKLRGWLKRPRADDTGKSESGAAPTIPPLPSMPSWLDRVADWASRHVPDPSAEINEERERELNRLLHLLKENPDAGLRRAVPLAGQFQNRGRALPTGRLGSRTPDFNLGSLRGGRASDPWNVPPDLHARLRERYRELAGEEARLGRHRRAAYIHAQLLGDLSSAAACLKQGQHFHEAAVLYRDHLHRLVEAADCFASGGEWATALMLYEKEKRHLQAAAMHEAMGEPARAAEAYRLEVARLLAADDLLAAADLLATRLAAAEEALTILRDGWPRSRQAARCLEKAFELLGARGTHAQTANLLAELSAETTPPAQTLPLARILATAQETYPDEPVRDLARDLARVKMSTRLATADSAEVRGCVEILARLAPADPLLLRDGNRYLAARQEQEKRRAALPPVRSLAAAPATAPPLPGRRAPRRTHDFRMEPGNVRWLAVQAAGNHFYAAGHRAVTSEIVLVRSTWDGADQPLIGWRGIDAKALPEESLPLLLAVPQLGNSDVVVAVPDSPLRRAPVLTPRRFALPAGRWSKIPMAGGQPTWWPLSVITATYAADGNLWLLRAEDGGNTVSGLSFVLSCHTGDGELVSQLQPPLPDITATANWQVGSGIHLASVGGCLLLGCGNRLLVRQGGKDEWTELEFESSITGLTPAPRLARTGCAIQLTEGVMLLWMDSPGSVREVTSDLHMPLAAFTRFGTLVVVSGSEGEGRLFEMVRGEARSIGGFVHREQSRTIAVVGTDEREGFALFDANGQVSLYTA